MRQGRLALPLFTAIALIWVLPLVHLVQQSLSGGLDNYRTVLTQNGLGRNLLNSAIVSAATILIVIAVSSMAAFAISNLAFPLRDTSYLVMLTGLMMPTAAIVVPLSQIVNSLGWNNTYQALFIPYAALAFPFALLLLKAAFDDLPDALAEAAVLDGASHWKLFFRVLLPLTAPTLIMVTIWTFLGAWNELLLALIFEHDPQMQTITVVPLSFQNRFFVDVPKIFAALVIIEIPVVVLYLLFQRRFERGLTAGAVK